MSSPVTARRGVIVGEVGMLLAVVGTLLRHEVINYEWILVAFFVGSAIGVPIAYIMPMTAVPQRTAFSHACGALASALIGTAEYLRRIPHGFVMGALILETLLGFLTCTATNAVWLEDRPLVHSTRSTRISSRYRNVHGQ